MENNGDTILRPIRKLARRKFENFSGGIRIDAATREFVIEWRNFLLNENISPNSVRTYFSVLGINRKFSIELPRRVRNSAPRRFLTFDQILALFQAIQDEDDLILLQSYILTDKKMPHMTQKINMRLRKYARRAGLQTFGVRVFRFTRHWLTLEELDKIKNLQLHCSQPQPVAWVKFKMQKRGRIMRAHR